MPVKSLEDAAKDLNVGIATTVRAKKIQKHGAPELVEAVDKGDVTVHAAHKVAMLPKEEQSAIVQQGPEAVKKKRRNCGRSRNRHLSRLPNMPRRRKSEESTVIFGAL